jgi:DNA-binding HxlR family transcriptional regulator
MKGYGQFCPVAKSAEVFAQRWTPLVLRELLCGARRFNDLQRGVPLMSRALLVQRLKELEFAGIVETLPRDKGGHEYRLTEAGEAFRATIEALSAWGHEWGQGRVGPDDLNATQLVWAMRHHADPAQRPAGRIVARIEFRGFRRRDASRKTWWLVVSPGDIDVCIKYPGFTEDIVIRAELGAFTRVWLGYAGLRAARAAGAVAIEGERAVVAAFERAVGLHAEPTTKSFRFSPIPV